MDIGQIMLDTRTGRTGVLMAILEIGEQELAFLRPQGGGIEWDADPGDLTDPDVEP